jgi:hypothetical protein
MKLEVIQQEIQLVVAEAPRIIKVARIIVMSFALWLGVNRAIERARILFRRKLLSVIATHAPLRRGLG